MRKIEYFCQNLQHSHSIQEQLEEAQKGGIVKSYTLTTLSAMNARRDADICLWCDEIWSPDHIHSCLCVPDHNCIFTCGENLEVFAFVKVSKEGLKPMSLKESQDEVANIHANNVFDEMCDPNLCLSPDLACEPSAPRVFDEMFEPIQTLNHDINALVIDEVAPVYETIAKHDDTNIQLSVVEHLQDVIDSAHKVFVEMPVPTFMLEMAQNATTTHSEPIHSAPEILSTKVQGDEDEGYDNDELEVDVKCSAPAFCLNDDVPSVFGVIYGHHLINELPTLNARNMLDCPSELKPLVLNLGPKNVTIFTPFHIITSTLPFLDVENEVPWWGENRMSSECVVWKKISGSIYYHIIFDPGISFLLINIAESCPYSKSFDLRNGCKSNISYKEAYSWDNSNIDLGFWKENVHIIAPPTFQYDDTRCLLNNRVIVIAVHFDHNEPSRLFVVALSSHVYVLVSADLNKNVNIKWHFCTLEIKPVLICNVILTLEDKGVFKEVGMGSVGRLRLLLVFSTQRLVCIEICEAGFTPFQDGSTSSLLNHKFEPGGEHYEVRLLNYDTLISNFHCAYRKCHVEMVLALFSFGLVMCLESVAIYAGPKLMETMVIESCWSSLGGSHRGCSWLTSHFFCCSKTCPIEIFISGLMPVDIVTFEVTLADSFMIMPYDPGDINNLSLRSHFRICDGVGSDINNAGTRVVNGKKLTFSIVIYDTGIACDTCSHYSGVMISFLIDERASYQNRDNWEGIKLIYADTHVLVFDPGVVGMSIMMFSAFKRVIVKWACTLNSTHVFDPGGNDEVMSVMRNIFAGDSYSLGLHGCKMGLTFLHHVGEVQGNDTIFVFDPGGRYNCACRYLTTRTATGSTYQQLSFDMRDATINVIYSRLTLILEDKYHFKGWVMIHTKIMMKGSLVIVSFISYYPRQYSLYNGISFLVLIINEN